MGAGVPFPEVKCAPDVERKTRQTGNDRGVILPSLSPAALIHLVVKIPEKRRVLTVGRKMEDWMSSDPTCICRMNLEFSLTPVATCEICFTGVNSSNAFLPAKPSF